MKEMKENVSFAPHCDAHTRSAHMIILTSCLMGSTMLWDNLHGRRYAGIRGYETLHPAVGGCSSQDGFERIHFC